jgi:glycerol-1-phosphate dehydrogenase [NAD(P)+]
MKVSFPSDFAICKSESDAKARLLNVAKKYHRICLVTGVHKSLKVAKSLSGDIGNMTGIIYSVTECSNSTVEDLLNVMSDGDYDLIIGVGAGKVIDVCKRASLLSNTALLVFPTAISNDGLVSPIAVLKFGNVTKSLPGAMPDYVVISLEQIFRAPVSFIRSAACDLLTNITACEDWRVAHLENGETFSDIAFNMAQMASFQIINCFDWSLDNEDFVRSVVYGQLLSGVSMAIAGSSRPCSGSEHLISHALDSAGIGNSVLHGEKVGIASRFCLQLQGLEVPRVSKFTSDVVVSKVLPGTDGFQVSDYVELFASAKIQRPGRTTVLDRFTNLELANRYMRYLEVNT